MSTIRWLLLADFLLLVAILVIAIVTDSGMLLAVVFVGALNLVWILLDLRKGQSPWLAAQRSATDHEP
jgi:predicted lysophospholipase L1 biosynthesis ABC-type transport system permease subunit